MTKEVMINALSARGGGGQTYLLNIVKYFNRSDLKLTILLTEGTNLKFEYDGLNIYKASSLTRNPILRQIWEVIFLPWILHRRKIDIFFCPGGLVPFLPYFNGKIVTMFRNMLPFDEKQKRKYPFGLLKFRNWILSKVMLLSMQRADLVIFISAFAESVIKKRIKRPLKHSALIPHGVDFMERVEKKSSLTSIIGNEEYILYPSSIDVYKSQVQVVTAYSNLIKEGIILPKLIFAGSLTTNKNYTQEVIDLLTETNLNENIILSGNVDYDLMPSLYKNSKFVIYASQTENCPNILLEALSCNCLILCSNSKPMPEFAQDAVVYFDPEDIEDLTNQFRRIMNNEINTFDLKQKIPKIINQYSWKDCTDKTWNKISDLP